MGIGFTLQTNLAKSESFVFTGTKEFNLHSPILGLGSAAMYRFRRGSSVRCRTNRTFKTTALVRRSRWFLNEGFEFLFFRAPAGSDRAFLKQKRPSPPTSPAFSFTAFDAVFFGRRHSASLLASSSRKRRPCCAYSNPIYGSVNTCGGIVVSLIVAGTSCA